jgi:spermidine/putrescine-binding protein
MQSSFARACLAVLLASLVTGCQSIKLSLSEYPEDTTSMMDPAAKMPTESSLKASQDRTKVILLGSEQSAANGQADPELTDALTREVEAILAGNGVEIEYIIPKEGAQMWFDSMVIPKDAPNAANAHALINYLLRPDVAAANSNLVEYANANLPAKALIKPEVRDNPGVYPTDAVMARLFTNTAYDERLQRTVTRLWTRVKTGR